MEILPPSPPFLLVVLPHPSLSRSLCPPPTFIDPPLPSYLPLLSSLMSFFLSCVYPPWCLESSSSSVSIPVHSNLFSLPAECLFQPLTTFSPRDLSPHWAALCLHLLSNVPLIISSLLLTSFWSLHLPLFQACSPRFPFKIACYPTTPLPTVSVALTLFPSSPSLSVHQMVHFSLTQCILIPMAVACRVRAARTTATVY